MIAPAHTRYAPVESVHWTDAGRELVIFDRVSGHYHALNGTAAAIWRALGDGQTAPAIIDILIERYDMARDAIAADVASFLSQALAAGLISEVE